jgi:hypothetical protein
VAGWLGLRDLATNLCGPQPQPACQEDYVKMLLEVEGTRSPPPPGLHGGEDGVDREMMHTWLNRGLTCFHGSWMVAGHINERLQQKMCASGLHLIDCSHLRC